MYIDLYYSAHGEHCLIRPPTNSMAKIHDRFQCMRIKRNRLYTNINCYIKMLNHRHLTMSNVLAPFNTSLMN